MPVVDTTNATDLTFQQAIDKVWRKLMPAVRDQACTVSTAYTAEGTSLVVAGDQANAIHPGSIVSIEQELLFVESFDLPSGTATVIPGYMGSTSANHASGVPVYVDPKFSQFEIGVAINDNINEMSSPLLGLYTVPPAAVISYVPPYQGYDLGALPYDFIDIIEIRYRHIYPDRVFPRVKSWEVYRNVPDSYFPSGMGVKIDDGGFPGLPMYVSYKARFTNLVNLTDGLNSVGGLAFTMFDIPIWGAEIDLTLTREVKRNFLESQPDARKAQEVPPGATSNAAFALLKRWQMKIDSESARLARQYPSRHPGW